MSKIFLIFLSFLFLQSCSNFDQQWVLDNPKKNRDLKKIEFGDIILTEKNWKNPMSWFGHSAIMIDNYRVGEYPSPFEDYHEMDVIIWLAYKSNDYSVLRYKNFDEKFSRFFKKNLITFKNKKYCFTDKKNPDSFYCSKFIWHLFWKTASDLGYSLDIDVSKGYFVTPYDLMHSKYFRKVEI